MGSSLSHCSDIKNSCISSKPNDPENQEKLQSEPIATIKKLDLQSKSTQSSQINSQEKPKVKLRRQYSETSTQQTIFESIQKDQQLFYSQREMIPPCSSPLEEDIQLKNLIYDKFKDREIQEFIELRKVQEKTQEIQSQELQVIQNQKDTALSSMDLGNIELEDIYKNDDEKYMKINRDYVVDLFNTYNLDNKQRFQWEQIYSDRLVKVWISKRGSDREQISPFIKSEILIDLSKRRDDNLFIDDELLTKVRDSLHNPIQRSKWDDKINDLRIIDSKGDNLLCIYQRNKSPGGPGMPSRYFIEKKMMYDIKGEELTSQFFVYTSELPNIEVI
ncbi:UNKNOWN [Stylonychia lemnae]|uniref:START domain-containing protein n=1 Tax=Stylonychia lemnae TaxID=5949 RepID=A0A078A9S8_STYLE|nr:UNKNOWN [Stylonychia lemnae]|eukprot:CDW78934.1 UNKNOWN [Stylonychia lemnae]